MGYFDSSAYQKRNALGILFYLLIVIFGTFAALFVGNGQENVNNLIKVGLYLIPAFVIIFLTLIDKFFLKTADFTIVHDPQKGILSRFFSTKWNDWRVYGIITFAIAVPVFYYFGILRQFSFIAIERYQILEIAQVYLAGEPASTGEVLMFALIYATIYYFVQKWVKKNYAGVSVLSFFGMVFAVLVLTAFHLAHYGSSEKDLFAVFNFFFFFQGIPLWLFGSIVPLIIFHNVGNYFDAFRTLFSNQLIEVIVLTGYFMFIIFVGFYVIRTVFLNPKRRAT